MMSCTLTINASRTAAHGVAVLLRCLIPDREWRVPESLAAIESILFPEHDPDISDQSSSRPVAVVNPLHNQGQWPVQIEAKEVEQTPGSGHDELPTITPRQHYVRAYCREYRKSERAELAQSYDAAKARAAGQAAGKAAVAQLKQTTRSDKSCCFSLILLLCVPASENFYTIPTKPILEETFPGEGSLNL